MPLLHLLHPRIIVIWARPVLKWVTRHGSHRFILLRKGAPMRRSTPTLHTERGNYKNCRAIENHRIWQSLANEVCFRFQLLFMEAAKGHPAETCRSQLRDQSNARRERATVRVRLPEKCPFFQTENKLAGNGKR